MKAVRNRRSKIILEEFSKVLSRTIIGHALVLSRTIGHAINPAIYRGVAGRLRIETVSTVSPVPDERSSWIVDRETVETVEESSEGRQTPR